MNDKKKLAILIPAYKAQYFQKTLVSLVNQTNKDFIVYICNDGGDHKIDEIVERYKNCLQLEYYYFNQNLGRKSIIASWNRCLSLMNNEPYFIMFSDDDELAEDCVEKLYDAITRNPKVNVFHFNLTFIDSSSFIVKETPIYPNNPPLNGMTFFRKLIRREIDARMPDFCFRTEAFLFHGGFIEFPLAMRSDNATVINCSLTNVIYPVNATVFWRTSTLNISSNLYSQLQKKGLAIASIRYIHWLKSKIEFNYLDDCISCKYIVRIVAQLELSFSSKVRWLTYYNNSYRKFNLELLIMIILLIGIEFKRWASHFVKVAL